MRCPEVLEGHAPLVSCGVWSFKPTFSERPQRRGGLGDRPGLAGFPSMLVRTLPFCRTASWASEEVGMEAISVSKTAAHVPAFYESVSICK